MRGRLRPDSQTPRQSGRTALSVAGPPCDRAVRRRFCRPSARGRARRAGACRAWQTDRAALRAAITPAGQTFMAQPRRCVVDDGHMPAPLARNLKLQAGRLQVGEDARRCRCGHGCRCSSSADGASGSGHRPQRADAPHGQLMRQNLHRQARNLDPADRAPVGLCVCFGLTWRRQVNPSTGGEINSVCP